MINYKADILPLENAGVSDADIAAHLNSKTQNFIPSDSARYILEDNAAVLKDAVTGEKFGTLISHYNSLPADDLGRALIAFFIDRAYEGEYIDTSVYPRSVQFKSVCDGLPESLHAVCSALVAAGGGRPHSDVLESDIATLRSESNAADQAAAEAAAQLEAEREAARIAQEEMEAILYNYNALHNQHIQPLRFSLETDVNVWKAAIQQMANELS